MRPTTRMADFELFGHACEGAYAAPGLFAAALAGNATELNEALIEEDSVAKAIAAFMETRDEWSGTATELLLELTNHDCTEQRVSRQSDWPKDATRFSKRLRSVSATLRKAGIETVIGKTHDRKKTRMITLRKRVADAADAADANTPTPRPKGKRLPSKRVAKRKQPKKKQRPQRPQKPQRPKRR